VINSDLKPSGVTVTSKSGPLDKYPNLAFPPLFLPLFPSVPSFPFPYLSLPIAPLPKAGLTIRGAPYQRKAGGFFSFNVFILLNGWICLHGVLD